MAWHLSVTPAILGAPLRKVELAKITERQEDSARKLERASRLIFSIAGAKSRWEERVKQLTRSAQFAHGDALLAGAITAHLGVFLEMSAVGEAPGPQIWRKFGKSEGL